MAKKFKQKIRTDFIVVVGMVLLFIPVILYFQVRFLTSTLLFFAVPALYLFLRKPKQLKRLGASIVASMVLAFTIDFLAEYNQAWSLGPVDQIVVPYKLFGLVPLDVFLWYFFWVTLTVVYYEHFFEHEKSERISPLFKKALAFFSGILILVIIIFYVNPAIIRFRYAYLLLGILGALPFYYVILKRPNLIGKLFKASIFNIFLYLSFELTALKLDQWRFSGQYIGSVQLFGLQFPFEEFVFGVLLGTPIILSYYELFVDDGK